MEDLEVMAIMAATMGPSQAGATVVSSCPLPHEIIAHPRAESI